MKKMIAGLLALVMILCALGTAGAEQETRKMETAADADEFIAAFLGEHPEELDGVWALSAQMEAAIAQLGGFGGLAKQLAALGTPEKLEPAYEGKVQGMKAFFIPCRFTAMAVDIVLPVQDGAIAGLSTAAYSGGKGETAEPEESADFDSVGLALPVESLGELPGILTVPKGDGPFPAVVLIHGSGASDMDENVGNVKPFRDIAEGLAVRGVAVYRFDKRTKTYGTQLMNNTQFTLEDESIEDAVNAVQLLAAQKKIDPERILVLGHSLGGNAIPAIARALKEAPVKACGFIMMAASPRPLDVLMREQFAYLDSMGQIPEDQKPTYDVILKDLDKLQEIDSLPEDRTVAGAYPAYWKWLAHYDILQAAEEITQPVLLLQGEEDYQVTMEDFGIWQEHFGGKENWTLKSYPGLTHCFTPGQKTEGSAAYAREEKTDAQVILDIAEFVNGIQ
ncbi:MAG: alpha/beta fold hydrolase [Clostridia bacterium]|nr:alpha/beta fold hydrolase [Clostridia bacterium]